MKVCCGPFVKFTILFAETFEANVNIHFLFKNFHLLLGLSFEKLCIYPIFKLLKRAHI